MSGLAKKIEYPELHKLNEILCMEWLDLQKN